MSHNRPMHKGMAYSRPVRSFRPGGSSDPSPDPEPEPEPDPPVYATHVLTHIGDGVNTSYTPDFTGASDGDLAIVFAGYCGNFAPDDEAGWTKVVRAWSTDWYSYVSAFYVKVLTASDISSPPTFTGFGMGLNAGVVLTEVYRGVSNCALRSSGVESGSTLTLGGFAKSAAYRGLVCFVTDRDPSGTPADPVGWTSRATESAGIVMSSASDLLADYTDSSSIAWTNFTPGYDQIGVVLELLE